MQKRELGRSGINVVPLAFGGNVFGWTINEQTSHALLDKLVDSGLDFIDTADVYSRWAPGNKGGESETIIGSWLKRSGKRDKVVIATKCCMEMGPGQQGLSRAWITQAVEDSLRRLGTDYIDLYQAHREDPATPLEETLETFDGLVKAGKIRAAGCSNYTAASLEQACEISARRGFAGYQSLQPHYNLCERADYEKTLEPLCLKHKIGVISYYSLASGFLSGKYRSEADLGKSARGAKAGQYLNERGLRILAALDEVAARHRTTQAAVALAWLIARPGITAPIASATSLAQLEDLVAATRLSLDPESIETLNKASA